MPGIYQHGDYDLAGFAVGAVARDALLPRTDIAAGDVVIGLASSGVHANGFSLVRRIVAAYWAAVGRAGAVRASRKAGRSLADADEALCAVVPRGDPQDQGGQGTRPHHRRRIHRKHSAGAAEGIFRRTWTWIACPVLPVFKWLAASGDVSEHEMLRTFNCGVGMVAVVDANAAHAAIEAIRRKRRNRRALRRGDQRQRRRARRFSRTPRSFVVTRMKKRVAILISGRGSNMVALIEAATAKDYPAEIALVVSNRPDAPGLARARDCRHCDRNRRSHAVR